MFHKIKRVPNEGTDHQSYYKQFVARRSRQRDSESVERGQPAPCRPHLVDMALTFY